MRTQLTFPLITAVISSSSSGTQRISLITSSRTRLRRNSSIQEEGSMFSSLHHRMILPTTSRSCLRFFIMKHSHPILRSIRRIPMSLKIFCPLETLYSYIRLSRMRGLESYTSALMASIPSSRSTPNSASSEPLISTPKSKLSW
jgi:hypothetical protein